jgi:RNA polymerase sigma-70 factor (ECF subfamily)
MGMACVDDDLTTVERMRGRLFGIAYRMLGQAHEAEDLVQEAFLRWHVANRSTIESSTAWLVTVVTRLAIDRLRRRQADQVHYVGEWLPEPVQMSDAPPGAALERQEALSMAFLVLLERLTPDERAAFLLREVFDHDYATVADAVQRREPATRQLVHRAKRRLQQSGAPGPSLPPDTKRRQLERFLGALSAGDATTLLRVFDADARFISDGGGKVPAAINVLVGHDRIVRFLLGVENRWGARTTHHVGWINGEPGVLSYLDGRLYAATAFAVDDDTIVAAYRVMNPDKLRAYDDVRVR